MSENFILELKLEYNANEKAYLDKVFWSAKNIYNCELSRIEKKYKELRKTRKYRFIFNFLIEVSNKLDKLTNQLGIMRDYHFLFKKTKKYKQMIAKEKEKIRFLTKLQRYLNKERMKLINEIHISEYDIQSDLKRYSKQYKKLIPSQVLQKIGTTLAKSVNKNIFKYNPRFRYKNIYKLTSIEGKDNKSSISFDLDNFLLNIGLKTSKNNRYKKIKVCSKLSKYEKEALNNKICYCRIVRKDNIRGKSKYYLQLVLEGKTPIKSSKKNNKQGKVGIDTGTTTMAICGENEVHFVKLAKKANSLNDKIEKLQSSVDKSKKATNPNKYNEDGTYKRTRSKWVYSNRCKKKLSKLRDLQRKQKVYRKEEHCKLADKILTMGNVINVEPINYKGLAKRRKIEDGITKKGFGKSVNHCAPSSFLTILKNKTLNVGKKYQEINTSKCKASQYNHNINKFEKVDLSVRVKEVGGYKVQRDLYSAFLIMNVDGSLEKISKEQCDIKFEDFIKHQDLEIKRLKETKEDQSSNFGLEEF